MKTMLTTAALALAAGAALAQDTVRMGTEGAYPPYNYIDDSGEVAGFERELGDELCARAGTDLRVGDQRLGFDHPEPGVGQLRHDHGGHVDHARAGRGDRLHPGLLPADRKRLCRGLRGCRPLERRDLGPDRDDPGRPCRGIGRDAAGIRDPGRDDRGGAQRRGRRCLRRLRLPCAGRRGIGRRADVRRRPGRRSAAGSAWACAKATPS